jgi:hypothetical protein
MKHMTRTYKKEDAMLRPEHESTLEKQQAARRKPKPKPEELAEGGKGEMLMAKENARMKRKAFMSKEYDKWAKSQLDPTLDK